MKPPVLLYGAVPGALFPAPPDAIQASPFSPGGFDLAASPTEPFGSALVLAPPGTLERDWVLARSLELLRPGAELIAMAPKDQGGSRIAATLRGFGCDVLDEPRRRHRICSTLRPEHLEGTDAAVRAGAPRLDPALGLWTQPGTFSWDRRDPGSQLLLAALTDLKGRGGDFGCGLGVLSLGVLQAAGVSALELWDIDRRALECARRNVVDPRVVFRHGDVRRQESRADLDFVVMNPPFHDQGRENRNLGIAFIEAAAQRLRPGGACWLTANRRLPYEQPLKALFGSFRLRAEAEGFKVYEAIR